MVDVDFNLDEVEIRGMEDFESGDGAVITAHFLDEEIARFSFYSYPSIDDEIKGVVLYLAEVEPAYQKKGVGTKIMETVANIYTIYAENLCNNTVDDKNEIHYSNEGLSFMHKCVDMNLAKDNEAAEALEDAIDIEDGF